MSIQAFTLKNYRSFVDRTTIELRPLTLLFGYNNSGKSALLRALPLLADSLSASILMTSEFSKSLPWRFKPPLALDSPAVKGSHFSDLLSRLSGSQEFEIGLSLNDYFGQWTLRDDRQQKTHFVSKLELWYQQDKKVEYQFLEKSLKEGLIYMDVLQQQAIKKINFQGLIPTHWWSEKNFDRLLFELMEAFATSLQWLNSVRSSPLRLNPFPGAGPNKLAPDGEGAATILAYDHITGSDVLFSKVSGWYEKYLGQKIVIVEDHRELFQVMLQPIDAPHQVNMVDTGEGLIQVLPVLVAVAMAKTGSILAIEEPESHLQPRYHAALAEYFVELTHREQPPKVLLETHSENFLLRVQLAIAKGELDPQSVIIYWVHRMEDGSSIAEPVTVDELGRLKGEWNRSVFHDAIELSQQLIQARRELGLL